jgi:hypothetical protein
MLQHALLDTDSDSDDRIDPRKVPVTASSTLSLSSTIPMIEKTGKPMSMTERVRIERQRSIERARLERMKRRAQRHWLHRQIAKQMARDARAPQSRSLPIERDSFVVDGSTIWLNSSLYMIYP